ncbi:hypothetical protein [Streptomyces griseiscabiei]|uniref:Uncharacterized protein n=1 Tax=Streptomyces griseiscabiei TaxID=2993540 RepID=A0ABU4LF01_9ACTN|nr:hypothetical protein [Streptomyces griseiscabiei]MBZ3907139.1 hypothetical protein [Streptomyces griseiscabiei]MDX2914361.1 hypothetical protein [Streptomyces griseiscabiei]
MSEDRPVVSAEIPEFTGNLEQLETDAGDIAFDGMAVGAAGLLIDANFRLLEPFYKAPEADQLFATTAPVAAAGHDLQTELATVSKALLDYAAEVRPLVGRLDSLRAEAAAFERRVADDEDWVADGDLIEENTARRNAVNAAWTAFQAAERACHNKIVALVGGEALVVGDGSNKENMYGYRGEDLNNAGGLPWGDPVEESNPWYYIHEHVWDFTVGFVVDGVWGTIKGLGTLAGFNGWDAAGQAWVGLGKLATGILITATPLGAAYWLTPADRLPSWLRDSRTAVVETGKALIAYDEWGKNPSRAAGAVTFNVLTTIFTGGAGGAAAGAGKAGAIAKAISFAGKAGRIVDPMTYLAKGIGGTAVKIGDVMAGLRGITDGTHIRLGEGTYQIADAPNLTDDLPAGLTPDNSVRMTTPEGEIVYLDTKTLLMHNADGTVRESLDDIRHEATAQQRADETGAPRATGERELVGAGAGTRVGDTAAVGGRGGDNVTAGGDRGGDGLPPRSSDAGGSGWLDDLGRSGDGAGGLGDEATAGGRADEGADGGGELNSGRSDKPDARAIMQRHVDLANNDPRWFKDHYRSNGYRRSASAEVFGQRLPILVRDPADPTKWISKSDLPPAIQARYVDPNPHGPGVRKSVDSSVLNRLDEWATSRRDAIVADKAAEKSLTAAEKEYLKHRTAEAEAAMDAAEAKHSPLHGAMLKQSELFGERVAEHHAVPERYPGAKRVDDGAFGNNRFDQIYEKPGGGYVVVEAKGSLKAGTGERTSHLGNRVEQGTREYFETILKEMDKRSAKANDSAEAELASKLRKAFVRGNVDYVLIKADATQGGKYAGYEMEQFNIGKPRSQ